MPLIRMLVFLGALSLAAFAETKGRGPYGENFHEVDPGKFYRSGQLNGEDLQARIEQYHFKTIINLRGTAPGQKWFEDELALSEQYAIDYISIAMSAKRLPHREELLQLLDAFDRAPRPILVHCLAGADRTGLASAIYVLDFLHETEKQALAMLSIRFFHIERFYPEQKYFMTHIYQGEAWARQFYDPCESDYKYYSHKKFCHSFE